LRGRSFAAAAAPLLRRRASSPGPTLPQQSDRALWDQAKNGRSAPFAPFCRIAEIRPMSSSAMCRPNSSSGPMGTPPRLREAAAQPRPTRDHRPTQRLQRYGLPKAVARPVSSRPIVALPRRFDKPRRRVVGEPSACSPLAFFGLSFFFDRQQRFGNGLESSRRNRGAA